ncbi:hypothetical protein BX666DRAFT_2022973 [Dichotomocladium elegans]|nr:hypothetical protein BX666DRAFT_2022973 [Dichotomocladium elegans]
MGGFDKLLRTTVGALEELHVQANKYLHSSSSGTYPGQPPECHQNAANASGPIPAMTQPFAAPPCCTFVYPGADGRLVYRPYSERGDCIPDFSGAGYNEGWAPLPERVPVVLTLDPSTGSGAVDDTQRIQEALSKVGAMPLRPDGFRGALRLRAGTYYIDGHLEIKWSGVVFQGDPEGGTVLLARTSPYDDVPLIRITGEPNTMGNGRVPIMDAYVPVGSHAVTVKDPRRFKIGDTVVLAINFNDTFIKAIGMDVIIPKGDTTKNNGWKPGRFEHHRRVIAIEGNILKFNGPITTSLAAEWGGGWVQKYDSGRIQCVALEYLECVFPENMNRGPEDVMKHQKKPVKDYRFADEYFQHYLVQMNHVENCWIRQVKSVYWRNFVRIGTNAVAITLQNCYHTFPQKPQADPCKPMYLVGQSAYELSGQMLLLENCHAEYSFHSYIYMGRIPGPNVVYQCSSVAKNGDVGPHMKWSTGQLYDNCNIEGQMIIQDRYDAGSGHGWSGAHSVVWNTVAHSGMIVQKPPVGQNFLVGCSCKRGKPRRADREWCWEEHCGTKVMPLSLYLAQLAERRQRLRE